MLITESNQTGQDPGRDSDDVPADYVPPPAARDVEWNAPFDWLNRGWHDFQATGYRAAFYGAVFVVMGYAIVRLYATQWQLTLAMIGGFFLLGPFLCSGVYELSRQLERGEPVSLLQSMMCWRRNPGRTIFFAILLVFTLVIWARVSVVMFALFSSTGFPTLQDMLSMIFSVQNLNFLVVWAGVGFIFASIVFATAVVSVPLMLDRNSDTMMAVFASVRALHKNPRALYLWAALIVLIVGGSLVLGFLPLIVTIPLVGHATWHAYRDLLEH